MNQANRFRQALYDLYLLCCERKGWNPERGVFRFENECSLSAGSVAKIFAGRRGTLERDSIDGLIRALHDEGHGVLRLEETDYWRERLHIERALEMMKITTTKQINKNLKNLPPDVETILYDTLTAYYRRTKDLWGIEAVALQILSRRQPRHENIVEDNFNDNKNAWKIINAVSSNTGRIRRLGRGRLQITGNGTIVLLPTVLPAAQNFSATATIYANDKAAVGLVVCSGKLMVDPLIAPAERSTYGVRLMSGGFFFEHSSWSGSGRTSASSISAIPVSSRSKPTNVCLTYDGTQTEVSVDGKQVWSGQKPAATYFRVGLFADGAAEFTNFKATLLPDDGIHVAVCCG